nr:MAG TPA: hypothetical protein [Caudoviricetes sp.]
MGKASILAVKLAGDIVEDIVGDIATVSFSNRETMVQLWSNYGLMFLLSLRICPQ